MFKEYLVWGHQTQPAAQQSRYGIDLMSVTAYTKVPDGRINIRVGMALSYDVHMTEPEFEQFTVNLKTAHRLKKAYD